MIDRVSAGNAPMATTRNNATAKKAAGRPGSRGSAAATKSGGKKAAATQSAIGKTARVKTAAKRPSLQTKSAAGKTPAKRGSGPAAARKISTKADTRRNVAAKSPTTQRATGIQQGAQEITQRPLSTGSRTATRSGVTTTHESGASKATGAKAKADGRRSTDTIPPTAATQRAIATTPGTASRKLSGTSPDAASNGRQRTTSTKTKPALQARRDGAARARGDGASHLANGTSKRAGSSRQPAPRPTGSEAYRKSIPQTANTGDRAGAKQANAARKPRSISPEQALANTQSLLQAKKNRDARTSYPGAQPHGRPATPQGFMSQEAQERLREQEKGQLIHTNIHGFGNDKNTSNDHH